ncbi:unnamed protein product [Gongylonema pulchrum]|uniref:Strawberry notch AAA domain-containing protein n=1 Tax=Gongylonema pulchrum TaxID=637853 RepID=A0A3P7PJ86_9BILA|nr:unnamed protein product [Gongylonema pulchrum]
MEAVVYACQAHELRLPTNERMGYLIGMCMLFDLILLLISSLLHSVTFAAGDGAGVGKGRTIACIIYENYRLGRKRSIWLSVSADLRYDAERDLRDIGAGKIKVYALNKFNYSKIGGKENAAKKGCIFATYSSLIGECRSVKGKYRTRLKQLIQWFGQVCVSDFCFVRINSFPSQCSHPFSSSQIWQFEFFATDRKYSFNLSWVRPTSLT